MNYLASGQVSLPAKMGEAWAAAAKEKVLAALAKGEPEQITDHVITFCFGN
jgi:hypothetical protein